MARPYPRSTSEPIPFDDLFLNHALLSRAMMDRGKRKAVDDVDEEKISMNNSESDLNPAVPADSGQGNGFRWVASVVDSVSTSGRLLDSGKKPKVVDSSSAMIRHQPPSFEEALSAHMQSVVHPNRQSSRLEEAHIKQWGTDPQEGLRKVMAVCAVAYLKGLRPSTSATYDSAVGTYEFFCQAFSLDPYPATEDKLMYFCSWSSGRISAESISGYLSGIRSYHIDHGLKWVEREEMPRLKRLLAGIGWLQKSEKDGRVRLPITFDMLENILVKMKVAEAELENSDQSAPSIYSLNSFVLFRAITSVLLLGLLRPSEGVVRRTGRGITSMPLQYHHLTFIQQLDANGTQATVEGCRIQIPSRKTDPFGERSGIEFGLTGKLVCATSALQELLALRRQHGEDITSNSYLFAKKQTDDGPILPVTYEDLREKMDFFISLAGYNAANYQGHSFRIGGATSLAQNGVPTHVIEDMGGWVRGSSAMSRYLRGKIAPEKQRAMAQFFFTPFIQGGV